MFKCVVATPIAILVFRLFGSDLSTRIELISTRNGALRYFPAHFADQGFEKRHVGTNHQRF